MTKIEEIKKQIKTYDKMIQELVDLNSPDSVVGRLELKRQKLIDRCRKLEASKPSTKEVTSEAPTSDPYSVIAKGQSLPIPAEDPYADQINPRQDVLKDINDDKSGSFQEKYGDKLEEIEKLNKSIEIYDDMILKIALHNPQDPTLEEIKSKRGRLADKVSILVSETGDYEYIPSAGKTVSKINKLDKINDKLHQCRTAIRRATKNLFKVVTSPDYIPGDIPEEVSDLLTLKKYKTRLEEQEQEILKNISKFFKAKLTI